MRALSIPQLLLVAVILDILVSYTFFQTVLNEKIFISTLEFFSTEDIKALYTFNVRFGWINYIISATELIFRNLFIAGGLYIMLTMAFTKTAPFKVLLKVTLVSELTFIVYDCVRYIHFISRYQVENFYDFTHYKPFTLYEVFYIFDFPYYLHPYFEMVSLVNVVYLGVIGFLLYKSSELSLKKSMNIAYLAGGAGILVWTTLRVFLRML